MKPVIPDYDWIIFGVRITFGRDLNKCLELKRVYLHSHQALSSTVSDDFTRSMLKAVNSMMLDMVAAVARKDDEDRRRRQAEGISRAKAEEKIGAGWPVRRNMN